MAFCKHCSKSILLLFFVVGYFVCVCVLYYGNLYLSGAVELTNEIENTIVEEKLTKDETGDVVLV